MDLKSVFGAYLIRIENKKKQVSYNYSQAIGRISRHYSDQQKCRIDLFDDINDEVFDVIVKSYNKGGQFEKEGDYGNGTNRAALNALVRLKKYMLNNDIEALDTVVENDFDIEEQISVVNTSKSCLSESLTYEKDLKRVIIEQAEELFPGYEIFQGIDVGVEYSINNKRIDILLNNKNGDFLIVELKSVKAKFDVFGQISMYIGLLQKKFPNNKIDACIIANEIDKSLEYAAMTNPNVKLKTYSMKLTLLDC